ncbi:MAG TPA: sugar ABC transporter permease [Anaerolineae bacterium]|nr:sugar ABC transporter permease [Anaerolineae bacterium]
MKQKIPAQSESTAPRAMLATVARSEAAHVGYYVRGFPSNVLRSLLALGRGLVASRNLILYLAPAALLTLVFFVFPLVFILYMSLQEWAGLGPSTFIGMKNYEFLWQDDVFHTALANTLSWVFVGIFIHTPLCVLVALILARQPFMWKFFRTVFFFPNVISTTAIAFLWYFVFHVDLGLINNVLKAVGLSGWTRPWLSDPQTALPSIETPFIIYIGFGMVLFLTAISTIPREYYEAAKLDGASDWQQDWHITLPLIRRTIALQCLFVVGYCLKMFEYPFIMTSGGPANTTMNLSLYIYRKMLAANVYGLSMAAGVVTLLVGLVLLAVVFIVLRRFEKE